MHRGAVVPQNDVAGSPAMGVGARLVCGFVYQPRQERPALAVVHALDCAGVRRDVERVAAIRGRKNLWQIDGPTSLRRPPDLDEPDC